MAFDVVEETCLAEALKWADLVDMEPWASCMIEHPLDAA